MIPTATPSTISIVLLSPIPGNVVTSNVQVLGSAIHPNFLQYQLEYGPDPNPGNLWYAIGGPRQFPVLNGVLGIWSTNTIPDGSYQLRLRVYLRDGSNPQTVVNNIRVQNAIPTPVPTHTPSIPRPIAAFTQDRTSGEAPLVVRFTNRSTGQISGYNWSFGDGSSSAEISPVHVFRAAGEYEVKLTVVGPGGQSNVSQIITVNTNPPVAMYEQSAVSGPSPLTVQFTDRSTGTIDSWRWDFGDGTTSNERSPRKVFTTEGTYNISLRVRGPGGTGRAHSVVTVSNPQVPPPQANFTPTNTGGIAPLSIQYTDTSQGQITSRLWEFGDGTTSTDQNPIHQFVNPGVYTVRLTVNGPGGTASLTGTVTVTRAPQAPEARFTANPTSGDAPLIVTFQNFTSGDVSGYRWDFGDGTPIDQAEAPTHTYTSPGTYRVRLTALGPDGLSDTAEADISVTRPLAPPSADFNVSPEEGSAPLDVQFNNLSSGDDIQSNWDFGDGESLATNEPIVFHTYEENGTYTVILTVVGPGGPASSATRTITVTDRVQAAFEVVNLTDPPGLGVAFQDRSTGNLASWNWSFGDGGSSTDQNPSHTYGQAGTYEVRLVVTSQDGVQSEATQSVTVSEPLPPAPEASFEVTVDNLTAQFTNTSTGQIDSTSWNFGDGQTSSESSPSHTFAAAGTYTVELIVSNAGGADSFSLPVTVTAPPPAPPVSAFSFSVQDLTVTLTDQSTGEGIFSWAWEFGDGASSNEQNPTHTFAAAGTYRVRLTVTNAGGNDRSGQDVTVTAPLPDAPTSAFTFTVNNLDVQFTDLSTGQIDTWQWDFGDGATSTDQNPAHTYAVDGTYTVRLTVANAGGSNFSEQRVSVSAPLPNAPTSAFTFTVQDLTATFTDTSTGEGITTWFWDFGDGATSTDQNPAHAYAVDGTYTVRLTVANAGGSNFSAQQVSVSAPRPNAPTSAFTFAVNNLDVQFTDLSTDQIDTWQWDFGDGATSTDQNPAHAYAVDGTYTVRLT
ncbi:MAG: PKD domain-containing protein, partial [Anaerolineae bacterium]|nr:PKD domain-containing protein [Anaerolineae bacterium]